MALTQIVWRELNPSRDFERTGYFVDHALSFRNAPVQSTKNILYFYANAAKHPLRGMLYGGVAGVTSYLVGEFSSIVPEFPARYIGDAMMLGSVIDFMQYWIRGHNVHPRPKTEM